jgi:integrase/recombinase XerD
MKQTPQSANFIALVNDFEQEIKTLGMSKSVVINYPMSLTEYFIYLEQHHNIKHITKIQKHHSEAFKLYLQQRTNLKTGYGGISNITINGAIKSLNAFSKYISSLSNSFKYAITEDYLPIDTAERIVLTQSEIMELYNATFESYPFNFSSIEFGQRDRVIIALLYGCGLRKTEAIKLDVSDIDFINKRLLVIGKGNRERYVPIPNQHLEDIRAYIQNSRYYFTERHHDAFCRIKSTTKTKYKTNENALLLSTQGTRLTSFVHRLDYLKSKTSIKKNITPHILRHCLGTHLFQNGLELEKIRIILGHLSIDTTQIYVHISDQLNNANNNQND